MLTRRLASDHQIGSSGGYLPSDPAARELMRRRLESDEQLLWAGRANFTGLSLYAILLGSLWMVGALQRALDPTHPWLNHKQAVAYTLLYLPLCAIGIAIGSGVCYGITDRRVLWAATRSLIKKSALELPLCDALGHALKISRYPFGILAFGGKTAEALQRPAQAYFAFFLGSRAPAAYQMLVTAQRKLVDEAEQAAIDGLKTRSS
jgi:hypothetical protein